MTHQSTDESGREERLNQVLAEYFQAVEAGELPDKDAFLAEYPEFAAELEEFFADKERFDRFAGQFQPDDSADQPTIDPGDTPAPPPGTKVRYFGDYELLEEIARGGMGVVYKARQVSLNRIVALKMILAGQLASEADVQRFHTEAEAAANLQHPNIVAIHEVGEHEGQHYFSMDYVEGTSLKELLRDNPLPADQAARYVRQVAQAIHYAHQQGVIHRDLKPSNILLARSDRIRAVRSPGGPDESGHYEPKVTDFGLAKRVEGDSSLTATGQVVGTPSYMPPEQAAGKLDEVKETADVYALGAILYELLSGRPPFKADTPLDTLAQVRECEPVSPRLLNRKVSRDLETIILKCLAKEPARRYGTAQALADDLGAFLEGRAIKARRPKLLERAVRWARKHRRSTLVATISAAASIVFLVSLLFGWRWYWQSRLGEIVLQTDGPAWNVEVLDDDGEPVIPTFSAPTRQPVSLPAGMYDLRLSREGRLSQTYQLLLEQGVRKSYEFGTLSEAETEFRDRSERGGWWILNIFRNDGLLWDPLGVGPPWPHPASDGFEIIDADGRCDLVVTTPEGMLRINGATGQQLWRRSLQKADQPAVAGIEEYRWPSVRPFGWHASPVQGHLRDALFQFVRPVADLDGDGKPELVWAGQYPPVRRGEEYVEIQQRVCWLLAVSAEDGTVKWWWRRSQASPKHDSPGWIAACPPVAEDVDGDGKPDLLALFRCIEWVEHQPKQPDKMTYHEQKEGPAWVEAISGLTGRSIWRYTLQPGDDRQATSGHEQRNGERYTLAVSRAGGKPVLSVFAGRFLARIDLATGKETQPVCDLGSYLFTTPVFADLTGDGQLELLVLEAKKKWWDFEIKAVAADGKPLWRQPVKTTNKSYSSPMPEPRWPLVEDLDADGRPEIIVPYHCTCLHGWVGVEVLQAATGKSRWRRRLSRAQQGAAEDNGIAHFAVGEDLDGDGHREVFSAALIRGGTFDEDSEEANRERWLVLAASSGRDGRQLWRTLRRLEMSNLSGPVTSMHWCPAGADGRPQLAFCIVGYRWDSRGDWVGNVAQTLVFSSASGRLQHTWPGVVNLEMAEFNGDGLREMYAVRLKGQRETTTRPADHHNAPAGQPTATVKGDTGALLVLRGSPPPQQQRLGIWQPAVTGRPLEDGRMLHVTPPLPQGDLDGDGIGDVIVFHPATFRGEEPKSPVLVACCGKDGRRLWKVDTLKGSGNSTNFPITKSFLLECVDLDADGRPEVLFTYRMGNEGSSSEQGWLAVLSGHSGKVRWKRELGSFDVVHSDGGRSHPVDNTNQQHGIADLNADGVLDLVARVDGGVQLCGLDGRNGRLLWRKPNNEQSQRGIKFVVRGWHAEVPSKHDLDGDGQAESFVVEDGKVRAVDGRTEKVLWERPLPGGVRHAFFWDGATPVVSFWQYDEPSDPHWTFTPAMQRLPVSGSQAPTVVAVRSPHCVFGLDASTGKLRWRCEGLGRVAALLAGDETEGLPTVLLHTSKPESTVFCQALPVDAEGKYTRPVAKPIDYGPPPEDPWLTAPLPFENRAKKRLPQAFWPALACLALVAGFAVMRRRRIAIGLLIWLLVIPPVVAALELGVSHGKHPGQSYAWSSLYWLWPYAFSAPAKMSVGGLFVLGIMAVLFYLPRKWRPPRKWRLVVLALLAGLVLLFCFWAVVSSSPGSPYGNSGWWEQDVALPGGLTLRSPLVWMIAWLLWLWVRHRRRRAKPIEPVAA